MFRKNNLVGSIVQNYKKLKILPLQLINRKFDILWVAKNIDNWFNINTLNSKRKYKVYNTIIMYRYKLFFYQRSLDYLGQESATYDSEAACGFLACHLRLSRIRLNIKILFLYLYS